MRLLLPVLLAALLSACARTGGSQPPRGDVMAIAANNSVDLRSADGVMFLQSAHTGFLEAPPVEAVAKRPARNSPGRRARSAARSGPEIAGRAPVSPVTRGRSTAPASSPRRAQPAEGPGPDEADVPEITVRPRPSEPGARVRTARGLRDAMEAAYDGNPNVNQARANLRAADEEVAVARSGNRPRVTARVSQGVTYGRDVNVPLAPGVSGNPSDTRTPTRLSLELEQPLFRGFRTRNATRQAEANVRAERERLRATRQDVLLQTALAFLDVRRFRGELALRQEELAFLVDQVEAARSRLEFGEATRTDVEQARARLEETRARIADTRASLDAAQARFRELTGLSPDTVDDDIAVARLVPGSLGAALRQAQQANPDINRAVHEADEANFGVRTLEGEALPSVSLSGRVGTDVGANEADRNESAEVRLNVDIPIYQGGRVSAEVRRAKEEAGSARIAVDLARDSVRSELASAWSSFRAAREAITAADRSIASARRALNGVQEELRVGQRTTIDVLNAQADLVRARITRLAAVRQRDAAAFTILRQTGQLDVGVLGLDVNRYDPQEHYAAVKDKWAGMRTPDGR